MAKKQVLIIVGSRSDLEMVKKCQELLDDFGIGYELEVSSAHRNPEKTKKLAQEAEKKGFKAIICAAGMSAALPGVVSAQTNLPVIGVPVPNIPFLGVDSLLSMVQMPSGVPVATVSVGEAGAKNSAVLAARVLALSDAKIKKKLEMFRKKLEEK
jgi:5-(carboxyamino)imidazole ribonucleotide mutase